MNPRSFLITLSILLLPFLFASAAVPGNWASGDYAVGDLVIYNGTTYIASQTVTASQGAPTTATSYWSSLDVVAGSKSTPTGKPGSTPDISSISSLSVPSDANDTRIPLPAAGDPASLLLDISTAGLVKTDAKMSGGFIIVGGSMQVLVTAKGSTEAGVDTLNNPRLEVVPLARDRVLGTNTDWATGNQVSEITSTGFMSAYKNTDAALLLTLQPGAYLADVFTEDSDEGGALVEVFDMNAVGGVSNGSKLLDISTNGTVLAGSNPGQKMTAGFIIFSGKDKRVLVTAKGSNETGVDQLNNPRMEIVPVARTSVSGSNKDWKSNDATQVSAITKTGFMTGYKDTDSALILTLTAGAYLVDVFSEDGDSGKALVEVFDVDLLVNDLGVVID
jgi:hypothetical protein